MFATVVKNKKVIILTFVGAVVLLATALLYYHYSEAKRHTFRVTFLDIGQGDSALINFANGQKMLVDCGANKIILSALGRALPFYDRTIDIMLATHPDLDHYGGCIDVLKKYHVKKIVVNGKEKPYDPLWQEWNKLVQESGVEVEVLHAPETWNIASSTLQFLSPDTSLSLTLDESDSNNFSIVFKLIYSDKTFLFTGDAEIPLELALVEKYCGSRPPCPALQSDTLKVGHHGSDGASSELFLSFVQPKLAVISVGKNKYGHPMLRVIKHLERTGAEIKRTDQMGDIVIK